MKKENSHFRDRKPERNYTNVHLQRIGNTFWLVAAAAAAVAAVATVPIAHRGIFANILCRISGFTIRSVSRRYSSTAPSLCGMRGVPVCRASQKLSAERCGSIFLHLVSGSSNKIIDELDNMKILIGVGNIGASPLPYARLITSLISQFCLARNVAFVGVTGRVCEQVIRGCFLIK